ncbi:ABC transporter ATP-binding protein [Kerstersia similis]|uniref:ABC transporter ATP-binding protein n=1 Tax=Kerstersia similis TaxID=206505 RepID=UPI0039EE5B6E
MNPTQTVAPILALQQVSKHFGGLAAVDGVSLQVRPGDIHALIGPNGAGKSTLFNLITGVNPVTQGSIHFQGQAIEHLPPHARTGLGMARTFQNLQIFPDMTVLENVMVGRHIRTRSTLLDALCHSRRQRQENASSQALAMALLDQLGLAGKAGQLARALSYGEGKLMEIARAMASEPTLVLLDEPLAGLPADAIEHAEQAILSLNRQGVTIVLVEHNVRVVMRLSDHISVLNNGKLISEGSPEQVRHDPAVLDAYLGEGSHA